METDTSQLAQMRDHVINITQNKQAMELWNGSNWLWICGMGQIGYGVVEWVKLATEKFQWQTCENLCEYLVSDKERIS